MPTEFPGEAPDKGGTPNLHNGYADLRNSVARHLPTQLLASKRSGAATLRTLGRRSKVKR